MAGLNNQSQQDQQATLADRVLTWPQYLIPQHLLSVAMHKLMRCESRWLKNMLIRYVSSQYQVDISEAADCDINHYPSFNAFFTRALREGVRPLAEGESVIASPVDGAISQLGEISQGRIIQAKGMDYTVTELLGGDSELAAQFSMGRFATLYLSPRDYHRIHMPLTGTLRQMRYVPGKLFSVSPRTAKTVERLFARNERVVTVFDTALGPIVLVLVGAIFVGSMETVWAGKITPPYRPQMQHWHYSDAEQIMLQKGQEMGRFNMGSTVVMLLPDTAPDFLPTLQAGMPVRMGQAMS